MVRDGAWRLLTMRVCDFATKNALILRSRVAASRRMGHAETARASFLPYAIALRRRGEDSFQRLQVRQEIVDLVGFEPEFRHRGMTGVDALGKRLAEGFDGITLM
jgi:hypothetical protein